MTTLEMRSTTSHEILTPPFHICGTHSLKAAIRHRQERVQDLPDSGREPFSTDQQGVDGGAERNRRSKRSDVRQTDR